MSASVQNMKMDVIARCVRLKKELLAITDHTRERETSVIFEVEIDDKRFEGLSKEQAEARFRAAMQQLFDEDFILAELQY